MPSRKSPEVDAYIAAAPEAQRGTLAELRAMIRRALPGAKEEIGSSRFPVYTVDNAWRAGFATRAKGPMLYVMDSALLDRYEAELGKLRSGKSCIEYRASKTLSAGELEELAKRMLAELASR